MFVTVTWDDTGEIIMQRELSGEDILDCDLYAEEVADQQGFLFETDNGHCPLGCCDYTVELADVPLSAVCWTSKSYFMGITID